jgi:NAD(P)H dehydrogenase (quinone)
MTYHTVPQIKIRAVAKDKAKADGMYSEKYKNLEIVPGDATTFNDALTAAFKGVHTVLIILPAHNREAVNTNYIKAAKAANVKHIVLLSTTVAGNEKYILGREWGAIEAAWKASTIPWTIMRYPMFLDNELAHVESIKTRGVFSNPLKPDSKYSYIVCHDIGKSLQGAAYHYHQHTGRTYHVTSDDQISGADLAKLYSEAAGKEVKYVQASDAEFTEQLTKAGAPKAFTAALLELHHSIDATEPDLTKTTGDYVLVTGVRQITAKQFVSSLASRLTETVKDDTPAPDPADL